jgi:hypothetical protein
VRGQASVLALAGALAGLAAPQAHAAAPAYQQGLHVIPFPGTPDASPRSNIIFSSLKPSQIISVTVTGSTSGTHTGTLSTLPDHAGTAYTPTSPLANNEQVTVTATLNSPQAGTASGAPNKTTLHYTFHTAQPAGVAPASASPASASSATTESPATAQNAGSSPQTMRFHSEPGLHPPAVRVTSDPDQRSGEIFLTPRINRGQQGPFQQGPMILDGRGRLVWFDPLGAAGALNLEVQRYQGRPVLTWWQGRGTGPVGQGRDVILNRSYQTVSELHAGYGYSSDLHEFQITPQGTALIDSVVPVKADLRSVGGPADGVVYDFVIQELDIRTNAVLWEWHALGHVPLAASYLPYRGTRYDYFHLNSIQQLPGHNLLICARDTWTVYVIDERTGKLAWELGGRHSSFRMGPGTRFEWQHDARLQGRILSVFDDASDGSRQESRQSSAKVLRLDFEAHTASLVKRYTHQPPLISPSQGSAQLLAGGNVFVGWGGQPDFSEYAASGRQIFAGSLPLQMNSYRAYRFQWSGQPVTKPALALSARPGGLSVYASWNGATGMSGWRVLGGSSRNALRGLARSSRTGFETEIEIASRPRYVAVQALGPGGQVMGTSQVDVNPADATR